MTRTQKLAAIWKATPRDFKGEWQDGTKAILILRSAGTTSVPLDCLTDGEIDRLLPRSR